jgi:hypothetical protein
LTPMITLDTSIRSYSPIYEFGCEFYLVNYLLNSKKLSMIAT